MKQLNLEDFIGQFQPAMQVKLRGFAARDDIVALVAVQLPDKLTASAFTEVPKDWPDGALSVYCKHPLHQAEEPKELAKSKTMQAVELVLSGALTAHAAAKQVGVDPAAVHRAIKRREDKDICPCCGQVVRDGFSIDKSTLKPKTPSRRSASS